MSLNHVLRLSLVLLFAAAVGCRSSAVSSGQWTITVDNQSLASCSVSIVLGYKNASGEGSSNASTDGVGKGATTLLTGSIASDVKSIKVVLDGEEQVLEPKLTIQPGKTLRIIVGADKKVQTKME